MSVVRISLTDHERPAPMVLRLDNGDQFIVVPLSNDDTVMLPGFNTTCSAFARALAADLVTVADQIDQALASEATATPSTPKGDGEGETS